MISVVICSASPLKAKAISRRYTRLLGAESFELVLIRDARSLAEGYNRGIALSHGEVVIFSHDDIEFLSVDVVQRLKEHLETHDIIGVAGTTRLCNGNWISAGTPYIFGQVAHGNPAWKNYRVCIYGSAAQVIGNIQALDGLFIACRRRVIHSMHFDQKTFDGFHCYDSDFTFAAYLAGFRLGVCNDIPILHASGGTHDKQWQHYMRLFADKYDGRLAPGNRRRLQFATAEAKTKAEILKLMGRFRSPDGARLEKEVGVAQPRIMNPRRSPRLQDQLAQALYATGEALAAAGKWQAAADSYREAARCQPDWAEAHCALGHALQELGKLDLALDCLWRALFLEPNLARAYHQLGVNCDRRGLTRFAVRYLRLSLRLQPDCPDAACYLAAVLIEQGRLDAALVCLYKALERRPDDPQLHCALGRTLIACQRPGEGLPHFGEALRRVPRLADAHSRLLFALNFDPSTDRATLYRAHRKWARRHGRFPLLGPAPNADLSVDRRLRVGYLSGDFRHHVLMDFVEPILTHHDQERFEVICYADGAQADARTDRLRSLAHRWRPLCGLSDADVAELVRADAVDVLVDLGGHTANRLGVFGRRPAPVQVTYLGYPNTTGLEVMDYRLTDAVADPPGEPTCHTEELVRLPGGFSCYAPMADAPKVKPPPALTEGCLTFGSPHKPAKLNEQVLDLWCAVLGALPTARLLVFRHSLRGTVLEDFRERFRRRRVPAERVLLQNHRARTYLALYADIDIVLDAFPWSGHATACQALWMGVPVLTLAGDRHAGRMVASVLTQLGLPDWVAHTPQEFIARAVQWAERPDQLRALRMELRQRMRNSPLCDGAAFTRHLEAAYRAMWRCWVNRRELLTDQCARKQ